MNEKKTFEKFVYAMMSFMNERAKNEVEPAMVGDQTLVEHWFDTAESFFNSAVEEAVSKELERTELKIVVNKRDAVKQKDSSDETNSFMTLGSDRGNAAAITKGKE